MENAQVCTRCIMTSHADPDITFDKKGYCNYCTQALNIKPTIYTPGPEGEKKIREMIATLKQDSIGKPYECVMGISGGLDSAYLAYLGAKKWGLRIAALHVDDGFDTEVSSNNIKKLCEYCGIDLQVITPDRKQYLELTRAYMLAGVPNLAVAQDNVLFSYLHKFTKENDIHHFLSGGNFALECILQSGNTCDVFDMVNVRDINEKFGRDGIDKLVMMDRSQRLEDYRTGDVTEWRPLNYVDYNRLRALDELGEACGFEYYGRKHLENYFTGFLQLYWFPQKFGVDKRTSHLSSMIISGQMTRKEALAEMQEPLYDEEWMTNVIEMVKREFDFTDEEFEAVMSAPPHQHSDYAVESLPKELTAYRKAMRHPHSFFARFHRFKMALYRLSARIQKMLRLKPD